MKFAVKNGGIKLDSFSGNHDFYARNGFEPVSWTRFDKKYAPPGWKPEYEEEPVIFYKYIGKATNESVEDFINRVPESKDYYSAMKIRDDKTGGEKQ